jgi:hypothetical protein
MTFNNFCALCLGIFFISSCNSGGGGGAVSACTTATQNDDPDLIVESSTNVIPVHVADSSTTGDYGYINEPLVAVKICSPGHTQESECQVIRNILLDTGSFGLRVFKSAINSNVELTSNTVSVPSFGTYDLAQCAIFGTGATWGPIKKQTSCLETKAQSTLLFRSSTETMLLFLAHVLHSRTPTRVAPALMEF